MNTNEYIDVSEIKRNPVSMYVSKIAVSKCFANPVLVFMPNLDYAGMHEAESLAAEFNIGFLNIPITLPMLDLIRQMEFAGVHITQNLMNGIESAFRSAIIDQLNEEGARFGREETDSQQDGE